MWVKDHFVACVFTWFWYLTTTTDFMYMLDVDPMLVWRWASVVDGGPTSYQHWVNFYAENVSTLEHFLAGALVQWLKLPAWKVGDRGFEPHSGIQVLKKWEVACSTSNRQGSNFESCVWRAMSSHSSHHPQEVLLVQNSQHVHKGDLRPHSFHFIYFNIFTSLW